VLKLSKPIPPEIMKLITTGDRSVVRIIHKLNPDHTEHILRRMKEKRLSENDSTFVSRWLETPDMFPVVAPRAKKWKLRLDDGGWMVGYHEALDTVLGKDMKAEGREMKPHPEDVDLRGFWDLLKMKPLPYKSQRASQLSMALAALNSPDPDDKFDDVDPHPGSLDLPPQA
jgi:hypothetical protein